MHRLAPLWLFLTLLFFYSVPSAFAQLDRNDPLDEEQASFFTGFSPIVLPDRAVEVSFVNSLTSFWQAIQDIDPVDASRRVGNRFRTTSFDQILRVSYGFSRSQRWDLGAEVYFTHRRTDDEAKSSPFRVFEDKDRDFFFLAERGISRVGLRARAVPLEAIPELTIQVAYNFNVITDSEDVDKATFLGSRRPQLGLSAAFYQPFNSLVWYFVQADWNTRFQTDITDRTTHFLAGNGYLVFDLTGDRTWFAFPGLSYITDLQAGRGNVLGQNSQQVLAGLGLQYQVNGGRFGVTLNGRLPLLLDSGSQYVEWVRETYSSFSLSLRLLL